MKFHIPIAFSVLATVAAAETKKCEADRTPVEIAEQTLCLLNKAMPSIISREDGSVDSLVWSHPERFPPEVKLPPGTFYLIVEKAPGFSKVLISAPLEDTVPSALPQMREPSGSLANFPDDDRKWYLPMKARLNGQPLVLVCREAILRWRRLQGAHDCELISQFAPGVWLEVHLGTVEWSQDGAWPRLDETWAETWPPYLNDLGAGLSNLFLIQQ